jgi:hypothetical protein
MLDNLAFLTVSGSTSDCHAPLAKEIACTVVAKV